MSLFRSHGLAVVAATILAALATPTQAASDLSAVISSGGGAALLDTFDPMTAINQGGAHLSDTGVDFVFGDIGSIAFGPDGTFYAVVSSGGGTAALVNFDVATGINQGGAHLSDSGADFVFSDIGGIAFGPDGALHAVVRSGGGAAALVSFDAATGVNQGGAHLSDTGVDFAFDDIGGIAFGPDGAFYAVVRSGAGAAGLVNFDVLTGVNQGGAHLSDSGADFVFSDIGGIAFGPDEALYAVVRSGGGAAALVNFDAVTGINQGGAHLSDSGVDLVFSDIGGIAFEGAIAPPSAVPEPSSWTILICGMGVTGVLIRRRRSLLRKVGTRTPLSQPA